MERNGNQTFKSHWGTASGTTGRGVIFESTTGRKYRALKPKQALDLLSAGLPPEYVIQKTPLTDA
jgi:hypothetical protein